MKRGIARRLLGYVGATAALLVGWQLTAMAIGSPALPQPGPAIQAFAEELPALAPHFWVSTWRVVAAIALGVAIGAPLGLLMGRAPRFDAVAAPVVFLTYPIPKVVFLPVLLVLFGLGHSSKIVLITLIVSFQILVTARDAARAVPPASVLSVRSLGAKRASVFRHVVVPAAMPEIFTALRIGSGTAVAVLFLAESIAGTSGLGYYIVDAWSRIDYNAMFAGIIAMALLGVLLYELLDFAEARTCRWTRASR